MGPPAATDFCGGNFGAGFERTENRLILEDEGGGGSRTCWWRRKNISVNLRCWNESAVSHNSNKFQLSLSENSQTLLFFKSPWTSVFAHGIWNKAILRRIWLYEHTDVQFVFIYETVPTLAVSLAAMKEQERYTLSPPPPPLEDAERLSSLFGLLETGKEGRLPFSPPRPDPPWSFNL